MARKVTNFSQKN